MTNIDETNSERADEENEVSVVHEPNPVPTIPQLLIAIAILAIVIGSSYIPQFFIGRNKVAEEITRVEAQVKEPTKRAEIKKIETNAFEGIALEAQAAYVWDIKNQRALYNYNGHVQLPLASLTKLMTSLVAYDIYGEDARVPITLEAISQEGENGFHDGDLWSSRELLGYTLMTSSNDGAYALAAAAGAILATGGASPEEAFIKKMNAKAEQIGLSQTYYTNPTGLDATEVQSGSYGSARDMAFLMEYILRKHPTLLSETTRLTDTFYDEEGAPFSATNTNQTVVEIPQVLGSKTGYTVLAGGNLVVAFDAGLNHPVVISVLGSTREGRFTDVLTLVDRTREALSDTEP